MSKKLIVLVLIVLAAIAGYSLFSSAQRSISSPNPSASSVAVSEPAVAAPTDRYQPYVPGILDGLKDQRRILYFYASWCPTCIPADADFTKNEASLPSDVRVIRVNYNDGDTSEEERALAAQYQITYQHTFVQIDAAGQVLTKWNGGQTAQLLKNLK